ncbi:molybdopterin-binding protein [Sporomusa sphaeroides]|uniref:molybdopterin-binding protein n=1 Tax=Sporomusa sphaeroides TaxID=47679 RepID=UPI002CEA09B8|nr:molybdopterin-binding protein [Sporomusa sphaeroides]HML32002.1 molybdopterin-binding protein [Sporomusa sphaeroides]
MKTIHVTEAIGMILGQDLTRIVPGEYKGAAFKKGHVIKQDDVYLMRNMGKEHIYVLNFGADELHENDAAEVLAKTTVGSHLVLDTPGEGKVNIRTDVSGLLKINVDILAEINSLQGVALSTIHSDILVKEGQLVASAKIIPLTLPRTTMEKVKLMCTNEKIINILPLTPKKAGLVITGDEVYYGRIEDRFEGVIGKKLEDLGSRITQTIVVPDDMDRIADAVGQLAFRNDLVLVTGGMSVDPDDVTPLAVRKTGAKVAVYGTPVLPGAMFLLAYLKDIPVLGIPACGMFNKITILDVVLPKVLVGEKITAKHIAALGHGGLCHNCPDGCRFPRCSFCK